MSFDFARPIIQMWHVDRPVMESKRSVWNEAINLNITQQLGAAKGQIWITYACTSSERWNAAAVSVVELRGWFETSYDVV
jgi:hypothetical protein